MSSNLTVAELRNALRNHGLSASGPKHVLVARLDEHFDSSPAAASEDDASGAEEMDEADSSEDEMQEEEEEEEEEEVEEDGEEEEEENGLAGMADAALKQALASVGLSSRGSRAALEKRYTSAVSKGKISPPTPSKKAVVKKTAPKKVKVKVAVKKMAEPTPVPTKRTGRKRKRQEEEEEEADGEAAMANAEESLGKSPPKKRAKKKEAPSESMAESASILNRGKAKVDQYVPNGGSYQVYEDWSCMLNQTNISQGKNSNKFYAVQVLQNTSSGSFSTYTRWGRVGERGKNNLAPFSSLDAAQKLFKKKYYEKTRNQWGTQNFTTFPGKYTQIAMSYDEEDVSGQAAKLKALAAKRGEEDDESTVKVVTLPSSLDVPTQRFISLIFNDTMFREQMKECDLDLKRMPLGALSKEQIARGYETLVKIKEVLASRTSGSLTELSGEFYSRVPHAFGRKKPPPIHSTEQLQKKMDMLSMLGDIELAVNLERKDAKELAQAKKLAKDGVVTVPHHLDKHYESLRCDLELLEKSDEEYEIIERYAVATSGSRRWKSIRNIWRVTRHGEAERMAKHSHITNRKLLWHGTNMAVVAAILNSGLRIMPHSRGRVGRGIYLASENYKSASYVGTSKGTGVMFLGEAALGREHYISKDDPSLKKAPNGYDSIVAKGRVEPDPAQDVTLELDGMEVTVPQGKPVAVPEYRQSSFLNSEYLVYKESQACIRYVLEMQF